MEAQSQCIGTAKLRTLFQLVAVFLLKTIQQVTLITIEKKKKTKISETFPITLFQISMEELSF